MSLLLAATIGLLVAIGVLQLLRRDVVRIVVGLYTLWNAVNLLVLAVARVQGARAPVVDERSGPMADPLVQAFVLTAIVITFGFTAFLVALIAWMARRAASVDVMDFREAQDQ